MDIKINPVPESERRPKPEDESKLGFGKIYSDHMFVMTWRKDQGWQNATISKYAPISLEPTALVFHYGQTIFEGLKAYRTERGSFNLFRPERNLERFNISAARLDMPALDGGIFMEAIEQLLVLDHEWVPRSPGTSLYVRPFMIATEPYIGLKSSAEFLFFVITGPVGAYYPEGFNPVTIQVCEKYSRAGPGGLGSAKTAANYAASLLAEKEAHEAGFTQVLWLDAAERKYVEEVGSMNILFKINGKVITPALGATTLAGITRDSVLELVKSWGHPVEERNISIDEVVRAHQSGELEEMFGSGTAAVISPVGVLSYKGRSYEIGEGKTGALAERLFEELTAIQYGKRADPFNWIRQVDVHQNIANTPTVNTVAV
ncbi:MAG: branched-chain amino acid aminotransferase [SAR324 cluster bacterium]|nr:branched-chain amino acid aminotransferase [SAR324 cluster bacterium]